MSIYIRQVARHLGRKGVAVDIFTAHPEPEGPEVAELDEGVRLVHLPLDSPHPGGKLGLFPYLADMACAVHTFGKNAGLEYDLVHSHYWLSGLAGKVLAGWWHVPHVTMLHTSALGKNRALGASAETELRAESERELLGSVDLVVAATRKEVRDLVELYGASPDKISVISSGVDLELFRPRSREQARAALGLAAKHVVLYVGRLEPEKGLDVLLDAVALMKARNDVMALIVGGGGDDDEEKESIRSRCRRLGIEKHVLLHEAVEHESLPEYYGAADVFVLPSCYETFSLATMEALASGTPVIASRVGIVAELPDTGALRILEKRSADVLAGALDSVLEDPDRLKAMAAGARRAVETMGWESVAERTADMYGRLIHDWTAGRETGTAAGVRR